MQSSSLPNPPLEARRLEAFQLCSELPVDPERHEMHQLLVQPCFTASSALKPVLSLGLGVALISPPMFLHSHLAALLVELPTTPFHKAILHPQFLICFPLTLLPYFLPYSVRRSSPISFSTVAWNLEIGFWGLKFITSCTSSTS